MEMLPLRDHPAGVIGLQHTLCSCLGPRLCKSLPLPCCWALHKVVHTALPPDPQAVLVLVPRPRVTSAAVHRDSPPAIVAQPSLPARR